MFSIEMMLMGRSESWHKPHHEELHLERAVMFFFMEMSETKGYPAKVYCLYENKIQKIPEQTILKDFLDLRWCPPFIEHHLDTSPAFLPKSA